MPRDDFDDRETLSDFWCGVALFVTLGGVLFWALPLMLENTPR